MDDSALANYIPFCGCSSSSVHRLYTVPAVDLGRDAPTLKKHTEDDILLWLGAAQCILAP